MSGKWLVPAWNGGEDGPIKPESIFLLIFAGLLASSPQLQGQETPPVIMIDPGHGGSAVAGSLSERSNSSPNNATSPGGIREKDLTLEFSRILKEELIAEASRTGPKIGVLMTRNDDVNRNFIERAATCNRADTACIVSIHFNAGGGGKALGSLSLIGAEKRNPNYKVDKEFGQRLADACAAGVKQFIPTSKSRGVITDGHLHGGLGSNFFFQLNRHAQLRSVPKCFLEVEFIDNPAVEKALLTGDREGKFRHIARQIVPVLLDYAEPAAAAKP